MKNEIKSFNIRVYGIIINENNEVLLTDEYQSDRKMTKFPGGGLQFGEGPVDCIKREALEEMGQDIEVIDHFYTTSFFQQSFFHSDHQLISIYYLVKFTDTIKFTISDKPFDFGEMKNGQQSFRWKKISELKHEDLSFPIDRYVANMLKEKKDKPYFLI